MNEHRFTRGAWFTLGVVLLLLLFNVVWMGYFYTLPTDGWLGVPPTFGTQGIVLSENLMGALSDLQAGDLVTAIEGIPVEGDDTGYMPLEALWQVGNTVQYTVEANNVTRQVQVPLVQWHLVPALRYWIDQTSNPGFVGMILFFAIATLAFFKRPNDHAARALWFFAALFLFLTAPLQVFQTSTTVKTDMLLTISGIVVLVAAYSVLFPPVLLQLALVFPRPKPIVLRHWWVEYLFYPIGLIVIPAFILGLDLVGYGWTILSIVGAVVLVAHSALTTRDALSRAQLMWGLWGFVISMVMFLTTYLVTFGVATGIWADAVNVIVGLSFSVLGITLAIAILRYRLFDIGIIIRRTVTYVIVTGLLLAIFLGSVVVLQAVFSALTHSDRNDLVTVLSTLAIAALFVPLRNRVQGVIDRRFNRNKYDAQKVLNEFGETVRDETDLDKLTTRLVQVVDETMQPENVGLWLPKQKPRGGA